MTSSNIAVFVLIFLVGLALGGGIIYYLGRRKSVPVQPPADITALNLDLSFRVSYVVLPLVIGLLVIVALAIFYPTLPSTVYYRFSAAGVPRTSIGREGFLAIMVGAQLLMVAAAAAVAGLVLRIARRMLTGTQPSADPTPVIWLMVNMIVLPQLIVGFVAVDSAYFARAGVHLMTPWLFSLIDIGVGTLIIIILFTRSFSGSRGVK